MYNLLSLDLSTHTGWSYFSRGELSEVGQIDVKIENYVANIKTYSELPITYPWNFLNMANSMATQCLELWSRLNFPNIVTEHTEGSSHRFSQRALEFIHFAMFSKFEMYRCDIRYLLNSDWRRNCKCYISQWPEMIKWNKEVTKAKRKSKPTKSGAKVAKINGKVVSKINAKKLSIYIAKLNHPGLSDSITTDDIADSINLGDAAINLNLFK